MDWRNAALYIFKFSVHNDGQLILSKATFA